MAKATLDSIRQGSDKLHSRWTREFAGKPRHTRTLADLERIIEKTNVFVHKAKQIPGDKGNALETIVTDRLKLYLTERDAIAEAQFERPEIGQIHTLGLQIDRAISVWRRHFAGRPRQTRDLARLDEVIASLSVSVPALEALQEHPEVKKEGLEGVRGQLEVLKDERSEIEKLRRAMDEDQKRETYLATAQSTLDEYRVHFARPPRATCSPERLERLIVRLADAVAQLEAVPPSGTDEAALAAIVTYDKNMGLLRGQVEAWQKELELVREARAKVEPRELTNQLGGVANQLFQTYQREFAGKERATRDLQLLSDMCDRLAEVGDLMTLHDSTRETINRKNIPIVEDRLRRYEGEWMEIAKAKAPPPDAPAPAAAPTQPKVTHAGITIAEKKP